MKKTVIFAILFLTAGWGCPGHAETVIEVTAQIADVPSGTSVPDSPAQLAKNKKINVLSAPRVTTANGTRTRIEVNQPTVTPAGGSVALGLTLDLVPVVSDKGTISFTGNASDRAMHGNGGDKKVSVMEFATREVYFQGWANAGETVMIRTAPIMEMGKSGRNVTAHDLVIYLTFNKKTVESAPAAKTPQKAVSAKKKSPEKKAVPAKKAAKKKTR